MDVLPTSSTATSVAPPPVIVPSCLQARQLSVQAFLPPEPDRPTVNSVLRRYAPRYLERYPERVSNHERHVLQRLLHCRQPEMGSHPWHCDWCGHTHISYNGCDNRHCANCRGARRGEWLEEVMSWSLPIRYLHVIVTLPHELSPLMLANRAVLYRLFLKSCSEAVMYVALRQYGARVGLIMFLHTWGQPMLHHVHSHQVVSAGGLSRDGTRWIEIPAEDHALDEDQLSARFRKRFLLGLWKLYYKQQLVFPAEMSGIRSAEEFYFWIEPIMEKRWHTYCQGPPADCPSGSGVLKYLARYVVGSAINDQRILSDDGQHVTIRAKDYYTDQVGPLTLTGEEFVHRYLLHILPPRVQRVRYRGLYTSRHREKTLSHCRKLLGVADESLATESDQTAEDPFDPDEAEGDDAERSPTCPRCLMPGMRSLGRHSQQETYRLLERLTLFWQSVTTLLLVLSLPTSAGSQGSPLTPSIDVVVGSMTTLGIDITTGHHSHLPRPDT